MRREGGGQGNGSSGASAHALIAPQDLEAEAAVLGAMILNPHVVDTVADTGLNERDFYRDSHRLVFKALIALNERQAVDEVTLIAELKQAGVLDQVGGPVAVHSLLESVPAAANARQYAQIVRDQALLRELVTTGTKIAQLGYEHPDEPRRLLDQAEKMIGDIGSSRESAEFIKIGSILPEIYDKLAARAEDGAEQSGVRSGFADLDNMCGGFQPGSLNIVGARASMGKTSFALNIAENVAVKMGKSTAIFSLEMSYEELAIRILCSMAKVDQHRVRVSRPNDSDWPRIVNAMGPISQAPLTIVETGMLTPLELRSKCRKLKRDDDLELVVIDYLQLMDPGQRMESRQQEISYISRQLKSLARELQIPIIALSQLSRGVEQRNDKRPMMSDLRESGAIEQDADLVLFIHRPEYYDRDNPDLKGKAELIIGKNRNGRTGAVEVAFIDKYTQFRDMAKPQHGAPPPAVV